MAWPADLLDVLATNKRRRMNATSGVENPVTGEVGDHADHHNAMAAAINLIRATLGINPQGAAASVAARIAAVEALEQSELWDTGPGVPILIGSGDALRVPVAVVVTRVVMRNLGAPAGSALTVQFRNSTGVMATLSQLAGATGELMTTTLTSPATAAGEYLWPVVTAAGSTTPATGVTCQIDYRKA
jgi:hypothetical protein